MHNNVLVKILGNNFQEYIRPEWNACGTQITILLFLHSALHHKTLKQTKKLIKMANFLHKTGDEETKNKICSIE